MLSNMDYSTNEKYTSNVDYSTNNEVTRQNISQRSVTGHWKYKNVLEEVCISRVYFRTNNRYAQKII